MGLNNLNYYAIDYMLETIFLVNYLLFSPDLTFNVYIFLLVGVIYYLRYNLDASGSFNLLLNSENNNETIFNNMNIQSAENCKGFSETIRQLSDSDKDRKFYQ
jgi:hypothetical protein